MATLTLPTILCCSCGIGIEPNATNMCMSCLRDTVDVTQDINTKVTIHSCHNCGRFLGPPWQAVALESKELMVMCLRKINGLNKVKLVDAVWIWTEPHSMRLKIKVTVQKEIMAGAVVQQAAVVEFVIRNQQCKHCEASFATGAWHAIVQVRQRVPHKRTFYYLEQLILKHEAHTECIKIVTFRDGMDFYYKDKNQALRFIEFLNNHVPTKMKYSRKLVSADHTNNTGDFKHNYLIEIAPICKDDLVLLPKELASKQSNISPLVLVKRISSGINVLDPLTGERTEINAEKYWRYSFPAMFSSRSLTRYIVLSVEPVLYEQRASARMKRARTHAGSNTHSTGASDMSTDDLPGSSHPPLSSTHAYRMTSKLADCIVARERDLGVEDTQFSCRTHLGPLLAPGDIVLGYDMASANLNLDEKDEALLHKRTALPDVILVRKSYEHKERAYTLRNLETVVPMEKPVNEEADADGEDREEFMQQVDGDREFRQQMNLYKKTYSMSAAPSQASKKAMSKGKMAGEQEGKGLERSGEKSGKGQKRSRSMHPSADRMREDDDDDEERGGEDEYDDEEVRLEELLDEMALADDLVSDPQLLSSDQAVGTTGVDFGAFSALHSNEEEDEDL